MTYQYTDAPANRDTVINAIASFAVTNAGFTKSTDGELTRLTKNSMHWCMIPYSAGTVGYYQIACRMTSETPSESTWETVAGQRKYSGMDTYTYTDVYIGLHLFTDGHEVNAVLEIAPGVFSHLSFGFATALSSYSLAYVTGSLYTVYSDATSWAPGSTKINPFDGAETSNDAWSRRPLVVYANSLYYNGIFYREGGAAVDGVYGHWGGVGSKCYNYKLYNVGMAKYNYRRPLLPMYAVICVSSARDKVVAISGQVRYVNLTGLQNKEVVESDWMIFPYAQRTTIIGPANSGVYGLAYKK